jgi:phenylacetate-coenzyme A ligase PaaK-like adenylate-forming protein
MSYPMARLDGLARHLGENVPYYKRLGVRAFADVPPSLKATIMANVPDFLSDDSPSKRLLEDIMLDRAAGTIVSHNQIQAGPGVLVEQTTGTSGTPGRFPKTNAERTRMSLGIWKHRRRIDPEVSPANFVSALHRPFTAPSDPRIFSSNPAEVRAYYEEAVKGKARWLHVSPRLLCQHIQMFNAAGYEPLRGAMKFCETTGEKLTPEQRRTITDYFGCKVADQYGCIETWAIAYDTTGDGALTELQDNIFVEILRHGTLEPITGPGEVGTIAVTSLELRLMPIVRYLNGDRAEWIPGGTGRSFRLQEERQSSMMILDGRLVPGVVAVRKMMKVAVSAFGYFHFDFIQFVQTAECQITIRMGPSQKGRAFFEFLKAAARRSEFSRNPIELSFEELSQAETERELRGKMTLFVTRLDVSKYPAPGSAGTALG